MVRQNHLWISIKLKGDEQKLHPEWRSFHTQFLWNRKCSCSPLKKLCTTLKEDIFNSLLVLNVQLCVDTVSQSSPVQICMFQQCSLTNYKTSAIMSSGQTRKWSSLTKMKSLMKTKQSTSAQTTVTYCRAQWWKLMISACFAAMNSSVFQTILKSNVQTSVWQLKIGPYCFSLLPLKVVLKVIKSWGILMWTLCTPVKVLFFTGLWMQKKSIWQSYWSFYTGGSVDFFFPAQ